MDEVKIIARLGDSLASPAQTRAELQSVIDAGIDGIQTYVHLAGNGKVVCFRDWTPRAADIGNSALTEPAPDQFFTLSELIELMKAAGRPLILAPEIRHSSTEGTALEQAVLQVMRDSGWDPATGKAGQVLVSPTSFSPLSYTALCPPVPGRDFCMMIGDTAAGVTLPASLSASEVIDDVEDQQGRTGMDATVPALELIVTGVVGIAGPPVSLMRREPDVMRRWLSDGRLIRVWTVDTGDDYIYCTSLGATQIVTNQVEAALGWRNA